LHEDIAEGFVWLKQKDVPPRGIVKITNRENRRSVYCEALQFEQNFLTIYRKNPHRLRIDNPETSIVMSQWYRSKLGREAPLKTQKEYPLDIVPAIPLWGSLRACMQHPQVVARVAVWLGVWSFLLALAPLVFSGTRHIVEVFHANRGPAADPRVSSSFQALTATEVFNLRSKCAELGERRMNDFAKEHPGDQIHRASHYDPGTNRCFVELNTMLNDHAGGSIFWRVLYEGETGEMLARVTTVTGATGSTVSASLGRNSEAFARGVGMDFEKGRWKNGDSGWQPASEENTVFVSAFIEKAMADGK
jgi:hypothetical protein